MTDAQPLTPAEAEALRAYMHDLDRQAAILLGDDPDLICPTCGYVRHDVPTRDDEAHDNICGQEGTR